MRRISGCVKWMAFSVLALCLVLVMADGIRSMQKSIETANATTPSKIAQTEAFKTLRQQLRAMEKAQLNDVIHDSGTEPELAQMARRQLLELCTREEQELTLEGVMALRGYDDPVVTVHGDSVNVILSCAALTKQESGAILELVCRETGVQAGNVKIIPIN